MMKIYACVFIYCDGQRLALINTALSTDHRRASAWIINHYDNHLFLFQVTYAMISYILAVQCATPIF